MDFEVKVVESSFVTPSEPTSRQGLWLSSVDLAFANRGHVPIFYLFHHSDDDDFFDVAKVKEALAKALVPFFPLAGRLGVDSSSGRMEIDCNGEGALFLVARSTVITVDEIKDVKPSPELRRQLVPRIEPSSLVLAVQVTFLKCGGVALGMAFHHVSVDAMSTAHFLQTWSALCRDDGAALQVEPPCHNRTLLGARSPLTVHTNKTKLGETPERPPVSCLVLAISKEQIASLRRLCGGASTFRAVSALVWRCTCVARRLPADSEARLNLVVNIRRRVKPPLPERYFGNALVRASSVTAAVRDITSPSPASVASRIGAAIDGMDDELVRSAIQLYDEMADMGSHISEKGTLPENELAGTSWLGLPMYDADFGWGKPRLMSRAESNRGGTFHLMSNGPAQGHGIRLLICMETANIKELERLLCRALPSCVYSRI